MTKENKKFWIGIIAMVIGAAFFIWGGIIYRQYPGWREARHIIWLATKSAGPQYVMGIICLYGGYFYYTLNKK